MHVWCRTALPARPCLQHAGMQNARENTGIRVAGVCGCAPPGRSVHGRGLHGRGLHGRGRRVALPGKANSTAVVSVVSPLVVARTTGRSRGRRPCGYYHHEYGSGRAARNTRFVCIGWKVVVATRDLTMWLCLCMWASVCARFMHCLSVLRRGVRDRRWCDHRWHESFAGPVLAWFLSGTCDNVICSWNHVVFGMPWAAHRMLHCVTHARGKCSVHSHSVSQGMLSGARWDRQWLRTGP